jgi:hypothetical protein
LPLSNGWHLPKGRWEEVTPSHRIVLPCHHEDSNLVYRVTKAAFYLSNSGGFEVRREPGSEEGTVALPFELQARKRTRRDSNPEHTDLQSK